VAGAFLERIEELNGQLNAYIYVNPDEVRKEARQADQEIVRGRYRGPLHGIPIAVKDNILTARIPTTAGSKILKVFVPTKNAFVVERLRRAGAIILGKTNLSEFAYGATTNNAHFGPTLNPWDTQRSPGGFQRWVRSGCRRVYGRSIAGNGYRRLDSHTLCALRRSSDSSPHSGG